MSKCNVCGEPMPDGEEMFEFHGYSGPCPRPPLKKEKPQKPIACIAHAGDWSGVYIGGQIKDQGHSINVRSLLESLGYSVISADVDEAWLESSGYLPDDLRDVVWEK